MFDLRTKRSRSRGAARPSLVTPMHESPSNSLPAQSEGRRSAERRTVHCRPAPSDVPPDGLWCGARPCLLFPRVRGTVLRRARSPSGAPPRSRRGFTPGSIQAALHAIATRGRYPRRQPRLSEAPRAPVVMPAGSIPGPPGSGLQARPQEPHPPRRFGCHRSTSLRWDGILDSWGM
jgi:hypothetical protein